MVRDWVGRGLQGSKLPKSENCIAPASANRKSPAGFGSGARQSAESWEPSYEKTEARPGPRRSHPQRGDLDARPEEQAMSWYYYLEDKISFPFQARCLAAKAVSPLRKGETVEVVRMAVEDACEHEMFVQIRWQGRKMAVPLSQMEAIDAD